MEYTFAIGGTYYLGVSGFGNTAYSPTAGSGDANGSTGSYTLVVSPGLAGSFQYFAGSTAYPLDILRFGAKGLQPDKTTWVVIHGWNSSRWEANIWEIANTLVITRPGDQVLTLDWFAAANTGVLDPFSAEIAIPHVATWAADALIGFGINPTNLNFVGHSFGSYVAYEIADRVPGAKVNSIVGLDPAADVLGGYDSSAIVSFGQRAAYSWAFHSSASELLGFNFGNEYTPTTAHEAIVVSNSSHSNIAFLFAWMLVDYSNPIAALFSLDRLLTATPGPWLQNQLDSDGYYLPGGGYEATFSADASGKAPVGNIGYVPKPEVSIARVGNSVTITWSNSTSYSGFVLQGRTGLVSGGWANVGTTPSVVGGSKVVSVPMSGSAQFFRLLKP